MKKFKVTSTFFAMLAVALIAFGCNENEDDPITPSGDTPAAPTALMATSKSATEIILKWTPSSSASLSTMDNYQLTYTGSSTPITINKSASTYTVTGLTEGTPYTFTLRAKGTNGELSNSATVVLRAY